MRLSKKGLDFIAKHEGLHLSVYNDVGAKPTIGYGHLIMSGEKFGRITKQEALDLLNIDVAIAERAVKRNIQVKLNQNQYDALVSFTYNLGGGPLSRETSKMKAHINSGMFDEAARDLRVYPRLDRIG